MTRTPDERRRHSIELRDIESSVDRTLTIFDVELFNQKPTMYPGLRFLGEF
jgi:hypothetical protein